MSKTNKRALLLINLGSPDSAEVSDVRTYLHQFLMDEEVIDVPWLLRVPLVRGIIVPSRAKNSAHAYSKIFTGRGSPLKFHTVDFLGKLRPTLSSSFDVVDFAMRYGSPSIKERVGELMNKGVTELTVVPMYPQFAKSSTRTAFNELERAVKKHNASSVKIKVLRDFFQEKAYVESYAKAILEEVNDFRPDHILLSYHGLPESHVKEFAPKTCFEYSNCCDQITEENLLCYRAQCFASSRAITKNLGVQIDTSVSFQSRLGRQEWIKPYTDKEIIRLREQGIKRLLVACPAFVADCLETLEEIAIRLREDFIALGGEDLRLVPSLNAREYWVKSFAEMINEKEFKTLDEVLKEVR